MSCRGGEDNHRFDDDVVVVSFCVGRSLAFVVCPLSWTLINPADEWSEDAKCNSCYIGVEQQRDPPTELYYTTQGKQSRSQRSSKCVCVSE